ncbi:MAG TPA: cytochrome c [Thermoanaerobaculia bacterium]|nr:cytochrome c [Thermoanaerobaculia bacterium]
MRARIAKAATVLSLAPGLLCACAAVAAHPPPSVAVGPAELGDSAPAPTSPAPPGFFSAAQAERGGASYQELCSECHARSEFRGPDFEWRWRRQTAWELFREISTTMPEDRPGSLSDEVYAAIVAYLLSLNDYEGGGVELQPTREALSSIALGAGAAKTPAPR